MLIGTCLNHAKVVNHTQCNTDFETLPCQYVARVRMSKPYEAQLWLQVWHFCREIVVFCSSWSVKHTALLHTVASKHAIGTSTQAMEWNEGRSLWLESAVTALVEFARGLDELGERGCIRSKVRRTWHSYRIHADSGGWCRGSTLGLRRAKAIGRGCMTSLSRNGCRHANGFGEAVEAARRNRQRDT